MLVEHRDVNGAGRRPLLGQQLRSPTAGRQPDHLEAVRVGGDDLQRLGADRAGAAQHQHTEPAVAAPGFRSGGGHLLIVPRPGAGDEMPDRSERAAAANNPLCCP